MTDTLLPSNANAQERTQERAIRRAFELPVEINKIWNPDTCPAELLPWLAWAVSVDKWETDWDEQTKRSLIKQSVQIHKTKGTIGAIRRVIEPFGYLIEIKEWWQKEPKEIPHTFEIKIGITEGGITEDTHQQMIDLIWDAKPVRSHMAIDLQAQSQGCIYFGAVTYCGDSTTVYPFKTETVSTSLALYFAGCDHTIDSVSIYPIL